MQMGTSSMQLKSKHYYYHYKIDFKCEGGLKNRLYLDYNTVKFTKKRRKKERMKELSSIDDNVFLRSWKFN